MLQGSPIGVGHPDVGHDRRQVVVELNAFEFDGHRIKALDRQQLSARVRKTT
jgi:hypothetical protein